VGQRGALFPLVALLSRDVHQTAILHRVEHLPKMVIGVAQTHALAWQANVVYVEVGYAGREDAHANHGAVGAGNEGNVEDQSKLAQLIGKIQHE